MLTNENEKKSGFFVCEKCNFKTVRKDQYIRHTMTRKHKMLTNSDFFLEKKSLAQLVCECGKVYKHRQSLSIHKKKCIYISENNKNKLQNDNKFNLQNDNKINDIKNDNSCNEYNDISKNKNIIDNNLDYKSMFFNIIKENRDFKDLLITQQHQIIEQQRQISELIPKVGNNNIKQKFNINIFLNEQCKDAINMDDFLKQINVSLQQLDITKQKGLTEGLSNVFIENMNKLSVYERPLHCTDTKRETLYIKENNVWEKDYDKSRIKAALKSASNTQYKNMKKWLDYNPDYMDNQEKQDYFINMVRNCSKNIDDIDDKIIKRICSTNYIKDILI